jgi:glycosyltransferase involved in cell wall biosynthesis
MSNIKLSIIVPFYNVEEWIGACLESLIPLNAQDVEVILVNDGSTDGSADVAETFRNNFHHFKIFVQKNGGLSVGRNSGLNLAKGKYVFFLDSDDYIDGDEFRAFLDQTIKLDVDISVGNGKHLIENKLQGNLKKSKVNKTLGIVDGPTFYHVTNAKKEFHIGVWSRLYKRSFLEKYNLHFFPGVIHEDEEFGPKAFSLARCVTYIDKYFYIYRYRVGSITKNQKHKYFNTKSVPSFVQIINSLVTFMKEQPLNPQQNKVIIHSIHKCFLEVLRRELYFTKESLGDLKLTVEYRNQINSSLKDVRMDLFQKIILLKMKSKIFWAKATA